VLRFFRTEEARAAEVTLKAPRHGDAGFDVPTLEVVTIEPGKSKLIRTGIHLAIPIGYVGLVRDRSSTAMKGAMCGAGVIDASYRGELKVLLYNFGESPLSFSPGDRIAQLVCVPHLVDEGTLEASTLETLGETDRGAGGFGSTGQ
jgi:dUTP pyrophosphatase